MRESRWFYSWKIETYVDAEYPKELPILEERIKIRKVEKPLPNLMDKKTFVVRIKTLKQELKHGSKFKKVHQIIRFERIYSMKPYVILNTTLQTAAKNEVFLPF